MKLLHTLTLSAAVLVASLVASLVTVPAQAPARVTAFTGARVIDGTDRAPIANATLLIRDGRIAAVGPAANVTVPAGAERVALTGKTVIPGLVNAHGHVGNTVGLEQGHYSAENVQKDLRTYAAYGVTTVFSVGFPSSLVEGDALSSSISTVSMNRLPALIYAPSMDSLRQGNRS